MAWWQKGKWKISATPAKKNIKWKQATEDSTEEEPHVQKPPSQKTTGKRGSKTNKKRSQKKGGRIPKS